jgi:hypothetical protein
MGKVVNAPTTPNNGGYENRTSLSKVLHEKTEGTNASGAAHDFEARVSQEQGTH